MIVNKRLLLLAAMSVLPLLRVVPHFGSSFAGIAGQGVGEFENWWWFHWWIKKLMAFHWQETGGHLVPYFYKVAGIARDLDIGHEFDILFLSYPLEAVFGSPTFHNVKVAVILLANGLAAWTLCRTLTGSELAAMVAATAMTLTPFAFTELQECRMAQAILCFAFLAAASWLRLLEKPSLSRGAIFGALLGLTAVAYWYYGLFLLMWCALTGLRRELARPVALGMAVAAFLAGPFLAPYLQGGSKSPVPYGQPFPPLASIERLPPGQLGPIGPPLMLSQSLGLLDVVSPGCPHALSLIFVALAAVGAAVDRRRWRWLLPVGLFWLLTLGPYLRWGQDFVPVPLPFQWLYQFLPAWSRFNWPWRIVPFVELALVPLAVTGTTWILERTSTRSRSVAAICLCLLLVELGVRGTLLLADSPTRVSAIYQNLHGEGTIELPFQWNSSRAAYYQAWHGGKTLGTQAQYWPYYGDPPDSIFADIRRYDDNDFLRWLDVLRHGGGGPAPSLQSMDAVRDAGYTWVIVHRSIANGAFMASRLSDLLGPPSFDDGDVAAWHL